MVAMEAHREWAQEVVVAQVAQERAAHRVTATAAQVQTLIQHGHRQHHQAKMDFTRQAVVDLELVTLVLPPMAAVAILILLASITLVVVVVDKMKTAVQESSFFEHLEHTLQLQQQEHQCAMSRVVSLITNSQETER